MPAMKGKVRNYMHPDNDTHTIIYMLILNLEAIMNYFS